jgi:hypothetical protein
MNVLLPLSDFAFGSVIIINEFIAVLLSLKYSQKYFSQLTLRVFQIPQAISGNFSI